MTPRDQIVDPSWWKGDFRDQLVSNVQSSGDRVPSKIDNDRAVRDLNRFNKWRFMLWQFDYSAGKNFGLLVSDFEDLMTSWMRAMDRDTLQADLADLASITCLLGFGELLQEFLPGGRVDFGTIERGRLVQWFLGDPDALSSQEYWFPPKHRGSQNLLALIEDATATPTDAASSLERYVKQQWYRGSKAAPWWGSHDRNGTPFGYVGYWSFKAAAIARRCGIDDSGLIDHKYYPYDLAHYLDA